jgi:hypothetical protein
MEENRLKCEANVKEMFEKKLAFKEQLLQEKRQKTELDAK